MRKGHAGFSDSAPSPSDDDRLRTVWHAAGELMQAEGVTDSKGKLTGSWRRGVHSVTLRPAPDSVPSGFPYVSEVQVRAQDSVLEKSKQIGLVDYVVNGPDGPVTVRVETKYSRLVGRRVAAPPQIRYYRREPQVLDMDTLYGPSHVPSTEADYEQVAVDRARDVLASGSTHNQRSGDQRLTTKLVPLEPTLEQQTAFAGAIAGVDLAAFTERQRYPR